jgi:hypothetical protein
MRRYVKKHFLSKKGIGVTCDENICIWELIWIIQAINNLFIEGKLYFGYEK